MKQAVLFDESYSGCIKMGSADEGVRQNSRSGTFMDNMKLPIHRWFRYSAGYSAEWVEGTIRNYKTSDAFTVLDPFAGSGTTLIAAEKTGTRAIGLESHPFVARIARAKLMWSYVDPGEFQEAASRLIVSAKQMEKHDLHDLPDLLRKCYTNDALIKLISLRDEFLKSSYTVQAVRELLWLAITSILRLCSHVGTAQWQYILPNKKKSKTFDPYFAFQTKISQMIADIEQANQLKFSNNSRLLIQDAREPSILDHDSVDMVITSPPYPNNYDYADATRLEMTFWGEIESWGDLQATVRKHIIRSCSQHSAAEKLQLNDLLALDIIKPIVDQLAPVCRSLEEIRLIKGGRKTYHTMIAAYFADLASVLLALRPVCKQNSQLCFVIGDSAPYGIHVPVEKWLDRLALNANFKKCFFEKLRDRNIKWKNRKHSVPLQEGRLWIEG